MSLRSPEHDIEVDPSLGCYLLSTPLCSPEVFVVINEFLRYYMEQARAVRNIPGWHSQRLIVIIAFNLSKAEKHSWQIDESGEEYEQKY